jgi:hypothetical protein
MGTTPSAGIAASALILAGITGLAPQSNLALQAKASIAIGAQIDTFAMMASARDLPTEEFQDLSFVFLRGYR